MYVKINLYAIFNIFSQNMKKKHKHVTFLAKMWKKSPPKLTECLFMCQNTDKQTV